MDFERYMLKKLRENKASKKRSLRESVASKLGPEFVEMEPSELHDNTFYFPDPLSEEISDDFEFSRFPDGSAPACTAIKIPFKTIDGKSMTYALYIAYGVYPDTGKKFSNIVFIDTNGSGVGLYSTGDQSLTEFKKIYATLKQLAAEKNPVKTLEYLIDEGYENNGLIQRTIKAELEHLRSIYKPALASYNDIDDSTRDALQERAQGLLDNAIKQLVAYARSELKVNISPDAAEMMFGINVSPK